MQPFRNSLMWSTAGGGIQNRVDDNYNLNASGVSRILDVSSYKELLLVVRLTSFTGGASPSFQPEWDLLDDLSPDALTPTDPIVLWKPTAATAATKWMTWMGTSQGAAPTISGWTTLVIPVGFGSFGQFKWTIANGPSAVAWSAYLYGKN